MTTHLDQTQQARFKKYRGRWHVQGPADQLQPGEPVEVHKRNGTTTTVTVADIVQNGGDIALASIENDRPTTRERKAAKADRYREWADSRDSKAEQSFRKADEVASLIPMGQPILVGHHSEGRHRRDVGRIESGMRNGVEHSRKAESHRQKADGIERQLGNSIYSDDTDAVERLEAKIADLEAQRERIKAYNKSCRRGEPDFSLLDDKQRDDLKTIAKVASFQLGDNGEFPKYVLSNLGGNIRRNKKRLEQLS